jgi:DNA-directed RNA polymerase subunit M/transcription elongation factor TFIIS
MSNSCQSALHPTRRREDGILERKKMKSVFINTTQKNKQKNKKNKQQFNIPTARFTGLIRAT